jgi:hypothetical protein
VISSIASFERYFRAPLWIDKGCGERLEISKELNEFGICRCTSFEEDYFKSIFRWLSILPSFIVEVKDPRILLTKKSRLG